MRRLPSIAVAASLLFFVGCGTEPRPPGSPDPGYEDIPAIITELSGLTDSLVVCPDCPADLLRAKTDGILQAMSALVAYAGDDVNWEYAPVTFHLQGDEFCGQYAEGMTGFWKIDPDGRAHACLFDLEKTDRSPPFTPKNAAKLEDQMLPVHEAMHVWFADRLANYAIEEPFCKLTSFVVSGALQSSYPDPCGWFSASMNYPDRLMYDLCGLGMDAAKQGLILDRTTEDARRAGRTLTSREFSAIVSDVLQIDVTTAFRAAGLLP